ncbi:MAG: transposase [Nitrospira sp.]
MGKFQKAVLQYGVARLKQCDNSVALSKELGRHQRLLYTWRDQLQPAEGGEGPPPNSREATLRKEVSRLKRVLADKTREAGFWAVPCEK